MPAGQQNQRWLGVTSSPQGNSKLQNIAVQLYVDEQDGNGPTLQTVFMEVVAVYNVDANGNVREDDDVILTADWKRQMLDELRAIRIGMERLNAPFLHERLAGTQSLIEEAQGARDELEDRSDGASGNGAAPTAAA
jgi:hypothetical protein